MVALCRVIVALRTQGALHTTLHNKKCLLVGGRTVKKGFTFANGPVACTGADLVLPNLPYSIIVMLSDRRSIRVCILSFYARECEHIHKTCAIYPCVSKMAQGDVTVRQKKNGVEYITVT